MEKRKIALLGFGSAGRYLAQKIAETPHLETAFLWNRSPERFTGASLSDQQPCYHTISPVEALNDYANTHGVPDLVAEMCHPDIVRDYGTALLEKTALFVSSLTAFAHLPTEESLRIAARQHPLFVPSGAAWGIQDILKMNRLGTIRDLRVTMRFHAAALKLASPLREALDAYVQDTAHTAPCTLYEGPVRTLASLAPNNVNTMTCVALAGSMAGLDRTTAVLQADKQHHAHETTIEVWGPGDFYVKTVRHNPARPGAVTGNETYASFWASLLIAVERAPLVHGIQFC